MVQPVGLVVSAPALAAAQAYVNRNSISVQQSFLRVVRREEHERGERRVLSDFPRFCHEVLGWRPEDLVGGPEGMALPEELAVALPEYGETLAPTHAVLDLDRAGTWLMLVQVLPEGTDLDSADGTDERGWRASPQAKLERLLRERETPIGLLCNGNVVRLVYAPRGESSGHLTFPVQAMSEVAGRPILAALHLLLSEERLFSLPTSQRLPAILQESRKYQNDVSTALAEQVLTALHELLRGLQAADGARGGELLREVLREAPDDVYGGMLTTLMRLVFLLYAEDRGLLPSSSVYVQHYSVTELFQRLREDAARYPDTMDQRYGAWARLLTVFRLIHDGGGHGGLRLPGRHGRLFDPDAYPFLEGRPHLSARQKGESLNVPRVSDGVVFRVLSNLILLEGERLSYRSLDVEQIGSVYEAMMGFTIQTASGRSVALGRQRVVVNLEELLEKKAGERAKFLKEEAGVEVSGRALEALKAAKIPEEVVAALGRKVSTASQAILPMGALYLQPTEERRRSGSHYTPRSLTDPIVRTTLRPVLEALGSNPTPEQLLDLKICDPAMGSGAFLVEACRFLADRLVTSWQAHGKTPVIPPDEDPVLHARRLVAQRCLYGVDKNPFAVDLAKLSLWLVTLAKEHPFTFLDHALRQGDSLVGLTREQIQAFHWAPEGQIPLIQGRLKTAIQKAEELRLRIHAMGDSDDSWEKRRLLREADEALTDVRFVGNTIVDAFFAEEKPRDREARRYRHLDAFGPWLTGQHARPMINLSGLIGAGGLPLQPFHWHLEFPEVFARTTSGFDAFVGNPPFAGKNTLLASHSAQIIDWLKTVHVGSHGNSDVVAHFFRRSFSLLRSGGAMGLIATNTIAQGDTRSTGLKWICTHGGTIFEARRRVKWPGLASVIVTNIHIVRADSYKPVLLDGKSAERISAFLFHKGTDDDPAPLSENINKSFVGSYVLGSGFIFDDKNTDGDTSPISEMHHLISVDPVNGERIFPYLGGEEFNASPTLTSSRFIIDFGEMSEQEARRWPSLMSILEKKVKLARSRVTQRDRRELWWLHATRAPEVSKFLQTNHRCLAASQLSTHLAFGFVEPGTVFSLTLVLILLNEWSGFGIIQSNVHAVWARFFASSMKDDLRYTPSDCFETYPFPQSWRALDSPLEAFGREYYEFRAKLMVDNGEGLTATYNRFHDPDESDPGILKLRKLHDAMDRAVLDAYGWTDLKPTCEFLLDYEDEETADENSRRKKPWRYRWPDEFRDEVLARLLVLNKERAEQERHSGAAAEAAENPPGKPPKGRRKSTSKKPAAPSNLGLPFDSD